MKKTYFVAIAVLLAVLLVGCDGFIEPPETAADNSEGLIIKFSNGNGGRALTTPIAAAGADYFEVVFDNGTGGRYVRTSWGNGATGRIIPGNGNYDNSASPGTTTTVGSPSVNTVFGKAYIFAGRNNTLLGVGTLKEVTNNDGSFGDGNGTLTYIDMTKAKEVLFEITALNTDVGGQVNPADLHTAGPDYPLSSTFKIELSPGSPFSGNMVGALLLDGSQNPPLTAPVFLINPNAAALTASFDITDTDGISLGASAYDDIRSAILVNAAPRANAIGYLWEAGSSPFARITTPTITNNTSGNQLTLPLALSLIPGTKAGLASLSIEIPIALYQATPGDNGAAPYPWYIRGGLNNTLADQGAAFNDGDGSLGGAVLIGVGEYNKNAAGLIIRFGPAQ